MRKKALNTILLGVTGGTVWMVGAYLINPYFALMSIGAFLVWAAWELSEDDPRRPPGA